MEKAKSTPWGMAQSEEILAPGIVSYGTASHGGIWIDAEHRRRLMYADNWLKNPAWWEEDCDWAIPYYFFAGEILAHGTAYHFEENLRAAVETVKRFHPDFMQRMAA